MIVAACLMPIPESLAAKQIRRERLAPKDLFADLVVLDCLGLIPETMSFA
jgi:hypothetical protein